MQQILYQNNLKKDYSIFFKSKQSYEERTSFDVSLFQNKKLSALTLHWIYLNDKEKFKLMRLVNNNSMKITSKIKIDI